jgi:hypothetical protein
MTMSQVEEAAVPAVEIDQEDERHIRPEDAPATMTLVIGRHRAECEWQGSEDLPFELSERWCYEGPVAGNDAGVFIAIDVFHGNPDALDDLGAFHSAVRGPEHAVELDEAEARFGKDVDRLHSVLVGWQPGYYTTGVNGLLVPPTTIDLLVDGREVALTLVEFDRRDVCLDRYVGRGPDGRLWLVSLSVYSKELRWLTRAYEDLGSVAYKALDHMLFAVLGETEGPWCNREPRFDPREVAQELKERCAKFRMWGQILLVSTKGRGPVARGELEEGDAHRGVPSLFPEALRRAPPTTFEKKKGSARDAAQEQEQTQALLDLHDPHQRRPDLRRYDRRPASTAQTAPALSGSRRHRATAQSERASAMPTRSSVAPA